MSIVIALDAMGGDNAPEAIVRGAAKAVALMDVSIILVGRQPDIENELSKLPNFSQKHKDCISILHAPDVIGYDESPTTAFRRKKESSIVVGLKTVKEGQAEAFVSAGSTGALLTASTMIIGRAEGIKRPALGVLLPYRNGKGVLGYTFLVDCGANVDCKPEYLSQFAVMGSDYMKNFRMIENPRVGLVNIGVEQEKGNALVKEAYALLKESDLNFVGNIEGREIPSGDVDVAVCDGFTGNVVLKFMEGVAKSMMGMIKEELMSSTVSKIGALLAKGAFKKIRKRFDYREVGGAPFLGLNHLVIKAHGSSDALAFKNAILQIKEQK